MIRVLRIAIVVASLVVVACGQNGAVGSEPTTTPSPPPAASPTPTVEPTPTASPTPAGVAFRSSRYGYSLVIPEGWTVIETPGTGGVHPDEPGVDTYRDSGGRILSVVGERLATGQGLSVWTCAIRKHLDGTHSAPVESTATIQAAGRDARLTRYHLRFDPYVVNYLNVEVVNGNLGLTLSMESTVGDDAEDETVLRSIVSTMSVETPMTLD